MACPNPVWGIFTQNLTACNITAFFRLVTNARAAAIAAMAIATLVRQNRILVWWIKLLKQANAA